jgi:PIN domain nuclease of toxin-antitoxin system
MVQFVRVLIDTHVFLWWNQDNEQLSTKARRIMADPANTIFFSVVSAWEIAIKVQLGKLRLPGDASLYVQNRAARDHMEILSISLRHASVLQSLERLHRDPFDRMLVAQSQVESLPILTADPGIRAYPTDTIW